MTSGANGDSIYGNNLDQMQAVCTQLAASIDELRERIREQTGFDPVDHCLSRIKDQDSMREKCRVRGLPETPRSALVHVRDAIGFRIVCAFLSDVKLIHDHLTSMDGFDVVEEKDYIHNAKSNGYRSYHIILHTSDGRAPEGCDPTDADDVKPASGFYVEVQLRTISMDTWAALEHHLKYKREAPSNEKLIVAELKRCADELASTDLSMQALRDLIIDND